jgi:ribosome biogenesis GTPase / thiamine phosphate phosphatase
VPGSGASSRHGIGMALSPPTSSVTVRGIVSDDLTAVGWSDRWAALLAEHGSDAEPGRVLRHDGVSVTVLTAAGERIVKLRRGAEAPTVGDWLALDGEHLVAVLDRASLLRRRSAGGDDQQLLAANIDLVLLVCGLDREVRAGRVQRGEALAWDAGARPVLVLTKADAADDQAEVLERLDAEFPALERHVTSAATGEGIDQLRARLDGATSVLVGESGAGKSRLVNAILEEEAAVVGAVRAGDRKGRHTTTRRQLHRLPAGGVIIDSPGIREVGLAGDEESVEATFTDVEELALTCRFNDCAHQGEPGCAVIAAIEAGTLAQERFDAYEELLAEATAAARRADENERRAHERRVTKNVNAHVRGKGSSPRPGNQR